MAELDLTAAIEAAHAATRAEAAKMFGCDPNDLSMTIADILDAVAIRAAAPLIERAVREQAAQELIAWADKDGDSPLSARRRWLHTAARKVGPKMTDAEVIDALRRGDFVGCHLDEAGRAIPPPSIRCPLCNTLPIGHEGECEP